MINMKHLKLYEEFDEEEAWWDERDPFGEETDTSKPCKHEWQLKERFMIPPHGAENRKPYIGYYIQCLKCGKIEDHIPRELL